MKEQSNGNERFCDHGTSTRQCRFAMNSRLGVSPKLTESTRVHVWELLCSESPASRCHLSTVPSLDANDCHGVDGSDLLRMTCSDENLVFALTVPLGERSLTAADVKGLTTYFQTLVGTVLRSSGLVPLLK